MTNQTYKNTQATLTMSAIVALGLIASACATHPHPHPNRETVPNWGGPASVVTAPVDTTAPAQAVAPASFSSNGRFTFTQGCTGTFSARDTRTNREISNGRAYNSGNGLIALDTRGRQTRAVSSNTSQSVTFLPDCNCRAGGNQSGDLPLTHQFAATAPSAASCAAS